MPQDGMLTNGPKKPRYFRTNLGLTWNQLGTCTAVFAVTLFGGIIDMGRLIPASTGRSAKRYGMIYVRRYDDGTGDLARLR